MRGPMDVARGRGVPECTGKGGARRVGTWAFKRVDNTRPLTPRPHPSPTLCSLPSASLNTL